MGDDGVDDASAKKRPAGLMRSVWRGPNLMTITRAVSMALMGSLALSCGGATPRPVEPSPEAASTPDAPPTIEAPRSSPADQLVDRPPPEVAPGTSSRPTAPVIEYPAVSLAEREGRLIELVEDLVIEDRDGDFQYDLDNAVELVVDDAGRLYVHDSARFRIVVYGPNGAFDRAYGGAGEMAPFRLGWIAVAGGRLAISTGNKVTVWTLEGEHLYDRSLMSRAFSRDLQGTADGYLVGSFEMLDREGERWYSVEKVSLDEEESLTYGAVSPPPRGAHDPRARAAFAATRDGEVYLTRGDEYVVQAFAADGAPRWILHVDGQAADVAGAEASPPELATRRRGSLGRGNPVRVDGHGNLYVFPYVDESWDRDYLPVDVYSPAGQRIFAGFVSDRSWIRAKDDAVYGIETDDSGLRRVVRYRVRAPFAAGEGR